MSYRIGIIGAGSIGTVVGGMLTRADHDVMLIERRVLAIGLAQGLPRRTWGRDGAPHHFGAKEQSS